jgi:hypothetical protein
MKVVLDIFARGFTTLSCSSIGAFVANEYEAGFALAFIAFGVCCYRILLGVAYELYNTVRA